MTIITLGDRLKKPVEEPLVTEELDGLPQKDIESGSTISPVHIETARKHNTYTTVFVFFLGMMVLSAGILGGLYCFQHWGHKPTYLHIQRLRGIFNAPGNNSEGQLYIFDPARSMGRQKLTLDSRKGFWTEEIETQSTYEKINVPAFNGSNHGLFVHDFGANLTAIVDIDSKRCFVMPLDRHRVLPPVSLLDFILKNSEGYYDVDTDFVRKTMRVVKPAVSSPKVFGRPIFDECYGKATYRLEEYSSRVQKRNAEEHTLFRAFAGKAMEVAIVNYPETLENESGE